MDGEPCASVLGASTASLSASPTGAWNLLLRLEGRPAAARRARLAEFIASYNEAVARKVTPPAGVLFAILQGYQASDDFRRLATAHGKDYSARSS